MLTLRHHQLKHQLSSLYLHSRQVVVPQSHHRSLHRAQQRALQQILQQHLARVRHLVLQQRLLSHLRHHLVSSLHRVHQQIQLVSLQRAHQKIPLSRLLCHLQRVLLSHLRHHLVSSLHRVHQQIQLVSLQRAHQKIPLSRLLCHLHRVLLNHQIRSLQQVLLYHQVRSLQGVLLAHPHYHLRLQFVRTLLFLVLLMLTVLYVLVEIVMGFNLALTMAVKGVGSPFVTRRQHVIVGEGNFSFHQVQERVIACPNRHPSLLFQLSQKCLLGPHLFAWYVAYVLLSQLTSSFLFFSLVLCLFFD